MLSSGNLDLSSGTRDSHFLLEGGIWNPGLGSGILGSDVWGPGSSLWDLGLQASDFRLQNLYNSINLLPINRLCGRYVQSNVDGKWLFKV